MRKKKNYTCPKTANIQTETTSRRLPPKSFNLYMGAKKRLKLLITERQSLKVQQSLFAEKTKKKTKNIKTPRVKSSIPP